MHRNHLLRIAAVALLATSAVGASAATAGAAPRRPLAQVFCEATGGTYVDDWPGAFGCFWTGGAYIVCSEDGVYCQEI